MGISPRKSSLRIVVVGAVLPRLRAFGRLALVRQVPVPSVRFDLRYQGFGLTPVGDLETLLGVPPFPDDDQFETIAGFLMYVLRKVPRPTERVDHGGFRFEVLDVDHHRIDQLLVTRLDPEAP